MLAKKLSLQEIQYLITLYEELIQQGCKINVRPRRGADFDLIIEGKIFISDSEKYYSSNYRLSYANYCAAQYIYNHIQKVREQMNEYIGEDIKWFRKNGHDQRIMESFNRDAELVHEKARRLVHEEGRGFWSRHGKQISEGIVILIPILLVWQIFYPHSTLNKMYIKHRTQEIQQIRP